MNPGFASQASEWLGPEPIGAVQAALPDWLGTRRWFADKGREIASIEFEDALVEPVDADVLCLAIVRILFRDGEPVRYLVPLAWTAAPADGAVIVAASSGSGSGAFVEAVERPWFGHWLIGAMLRSAGSASAYKSFEFSSAASKALDAAQMAPAAVVRAEQSNTSIRYGDVLMLKLVRRLQSGPNPDEEMLRALAGAGFDHAPRCAGGASWRAANGERYPVALAQDFVPNLGDGWSWMLERLAASRASGCIPETGPEAPEWLLGRRTGEMHVALSSLVAPGLAPEPTDTATIESDIDRIHAAVARTIELLQEAKPGLPAWLGSSLPGVVDRLKEATSRADGFRDENATSRIRVHGDYHLGQTLRTPDGDWVIIDFEGEPARPVSERRRKSSPLKDVAGMLRSFAYARGVAERNDSAAAAVAAAWESAARQAFLAGYRSVVYEGPVRLVPAEDEAFARALAAWELDKALYEVVYEMRNRPGWVDLPLRSLLHDRPG